MEPGIEAVGIAERREVRPGVDECFLARILGTAVIAQDQPRDDEEATDRNAGKLREGVMIARHRSLDEFPLHRACAVGATSLVALQPMSTGMRRQFPQHLVDHVIRSVTPGATRPGPARLNS